VNSYSSDFDAIDPREDFDSAHRQYTDLRARCPVAWSADHSGFWAVTRHADVLAVLADVPTYVTSVQNVVPKVAFTGRRPPLHFDPPEHTVYRSVLNPLLTPERVAVLEPMVRGLAAELLMPLVARGEADICQEFGTPLPVRVFARWMGLDAALEAELSVAGPAFVKAVESGDAQAMKPTSLALYDIARRLIEERKARPRDPAHDPTSAMLAARRDDESQGIGAVRAEGSPLPEDMLLGMVRQVLVVGIVAPTVVLGSMVVHLSRDRALQALLRAERERVPAAVEEFLRLYTPYRGFARTATRDVTLGGRAIAKDEPIALVYASANRDEAVFPEPERFVLDRPNLKEHIAFGRGPHYCAGAALGRLELIVMLDELLARTAGFEVIGQPLMSPYPEMGPWSVRLRLS
jgi:cytochrome P450